MASSVSSRAGYAKKVLLTGDIGGTHGRVQLWEHGGDLVSGVVELFCTDLRSGAHDSLLDLLRAALAEATSVLGLPFSAVPAHGVIGVCGPVWKDGRLNESNNIPRWRVPGTAMAQHDATTIEDGLGMSPGSLRFLNDFEAIGYAVAALLDPAAPHLAVPNPPVTLYAPHSSVVVETSSPACCVGAGTGLGVCSIVPAHPSFVVLPSEGGMASVICPENELEWRLLQWLRSPLQGGEPFVEIERVVSGPGISAIFEFLQGDSAAQLAAGSLSARAEATLTATAPEDRTATVVALAKGDSDAGIAGEPLCLAAVDLFLRFYGRFFQSTACSFLPYRGLYVAGGVLPKLAWRIAQLHPHSTSVRDRGGPLVSSFLAAGPHMTACVSRIPLLLLDDAALGAKGCLYYAVTRSKDGPSRAPVVGSGA